MSPCETSEDFRKAWAERMARADKASRLHCESEEFWEGFEAINGLRQCGALDDAKLVSKEPIRRTIANTTLENIWICVLRYKQILRSPSTTTARRNAEWLERLAQKMDAKAKQFTDESGFGCDFIEVAKKLRQISAALRSGWSIPRGVMGQVIREVGVREPRKSDELDNRLQRDVASLLRFWLGPDVALVTIARLTVLVLLIAGIAIVDSSDNVVLAHRSKRKVLVEEVFQKLHRTNLKNKLLFVHPSEVALYADDDKAKSQVTRAKGKQSVESGSQRAIKNKS